MLIKLAVLVLMLVKSQGFSCYSCNSIDLNSCKDVSRLSVQERAEYIRECDEYSDEIGLGCITVATIRGLKFKYREVYRGCGAIHFNESEKDNGQWLACEGFQEIVDLVESAEIFSCNLCNVSLCNDNIPRPASLGLAVAPTWLLVVTINHLVQ